MYSNEVNIHTSNREGETKQGSRVDELGHFKINNRQARRLKWIHQSTVEARRVGLVMMKMRREFRVIVSAGNKQQRFDVSKITSTQPAHSRGIFQLLLPKKK